MNIRVKICCIESRAEAQLAVKYGASALGLVSAMPSGPGVITDAEIYEIAETVPPGIASFLLTSKQNAKEIILQQRFCRTNTLQLVDEIPVQDYQTLREQLPGISIVQVIHVTGEEVIDHAQQIAPHVHGILLDSGNPNLSVKELGGTGRVHNWDISREIVQSVNKPVFLAGGLNPENIAQAVQKVRPFGVDICSGVRTDGSLDEHKLSALFQSIQQVS